VARASGPPRATVGAGGARRCAGVRRTAPVQPSTMAGQTICTASLAVVGSILTLFPPLQVEFVHSKLSEPSPDSAGWCCTVPVLM
jgi:hypothetical protein